MSRRNNCYRVLFLAVIVSAFCMLPALTKTVFAEDAFVTDGDYKYRVTGENTVSFAGYSDTFLENYSVETSEPLNLVIPDTIEGNYTVTGLDDNLFYSWNSGSKAPSKSIVSVTIPATVTSI